ncbi:MAG: ABC transporter permease [Thermomicrobiales bacterium]|nr:ABC transporter permease [Thermomicrobiales bacterium]
MDPRAIARFRELGILVFLLLAIGIAAAVSPHFLSPLNLRSILLDVPLMIVVAMGQTMVIISRNIDLSVGSILCFAGMSVGLLFKENADFPILLGVAIGLLLGVGLGLINGLLVAKLNIPAIIATLGTLSVYRGLAFIVSNGRQVDPNDVPEALIRLARPSPLGVPWLTLIALGVAIAAHIFLRSTRTGRNIYAIGGNPEAARLRGVPVDKTIVLVFVISGALSGAAGIMYAARYGFINPGETGRGFELPVIAASVIGGANVFGGAGSALGTLLGCLLLGVIGRGLTVIGVSAFWQLAVYGIVILLALIVDALVQRRIQDATRRGRA